MNKTLRSSIRSVAEAYQPIRQRYASRGSKAPDGGTVVGLSADLAEAADVWRFRANRPDDAPAIVGFFGGTGTGKSTLINALVQADVCHTSPIRPNTAGPVLYLHEDFCGPALASPTYLGFPPLRADEVGARPYRGRPDAILLVEHRHERFKGLGLLDCPDIDSFEEQNRQLARRLLSWLDGLCLVAIYEKLTQREYADVLAEANRLGLFKRLALNKVDESEHDAIGRQAIDYLSDRGWPDPPILIPRKVVDQLCDDAGLVGLREVLCDPQAGPRPIETVSCRGPDNLQNTLVKSALAFLDSATAERDHADGLIDDFQNLLPGARVDLARFTSDLSRKTRKQSWMYHFSFRQLGDHVDYVGRRVRGWVLGTPPAFADADRDPGRRADPADRAAEYLRAQARSDLDALHVALEDRVLADPLARTLLGGDDPSSTKIDPAGLEDVLAKAIAEVQKLVESARPDHSRAAGKTLHKLARRTGLPIQHVTKLVPYLVIADLVLIGGAMTMIQAAGAAVLYEAANLGLTVLTDDVRRRSKRIANEFQSQYRACLSEQVQLFVDRVNAGLASRRQLEQLRRAVDSLSGHLQDAANAEASDE